MKTAINKAHVLKSGNDNECIYYCAEKITDTIDIYGNFIPSNAVMVNNDALSFFGEDCYCCNGTLENGDRCHVCGGMGIAIFN